MDVNGAFPNWHRPWIFVTIRDYHISNVDPPGSGNSGMGIGRRLASWDGLLSGWQLVCDGNFSSPARLAFLATLPFKFSIILIHFTSPSIFIILHPSSTDLPYLRSLLILLQSLSSHGHCKRAITGWTIDLKLHMVYAKSGGIKQRISTLAWQDMARLKTALCFIHLDSQDRAKIGVRIYPHLHVSTLSLTCNLGMSSQSDNDAQTCANPLRRVLLWNMKLSEQSKEIQTPSPRNGSGCTPPHTSNQRRIRSSICAEKHRKGAVVHAMIKVDKWLPKCQNQACESKLLTLQSRCWHHQIIKFTQHISGCAGTRTSSSLPADCSLASAEIESLGPISATCSTAKDDKDIKWCWCQDDQRCRYKDVYIYIYWCLERTEVPRKAKKQFPLLLGWSQAPSDCSMTPAPRRLSSAFIRGIQVTMARNIEKIVPICLSWSFRISCNSDIDGFAWICYWSIEAFLHFSPPAAPVTCHAFASLIQTRVKFNPGGASAVSSEALGLAWSASVRMA